MAWRQGRIENVRVEPPRTFLPQTHFISTPSTTTPMEPSVSLHEQNSDSTHSAHLLGACINKIHSYQLVGWLPHSRTSTASLGTLKNSRISIFWVVAYWFLAAPFGSCIRRLTKQINSRHSNHLRCHAYTPIVSVPGQG